jgi:hypothetical protein
MKLSNYIAYDNMLMMMPSSLGQVGVMPLFVLAFSFRMYQRATQVFN